MSSIHGSVGLSRQISRVSWLRHSRNWYIYMRPLGVAVFPQFHQRSNQPLPPQVIHRFYKDWVSIVRCMCHTFVDWLRSTLLRCVLSLFTIVFCALCGARHTNMEQANWLWFISLHQKYIPMLNFYLKLQDVFNLLPNLNVAELIKSFAGNITNWRFSVGLTCFLKSLHLYLPYCAVKTNDMMLVIYLSSLIRSVIALHNLINNKVSYCHFLLM